MSVRPSSALREKADALALLLSSGQSSVTEINTLLEELGITNELTEDTLSPVSGTTGHIGIYKPEEVDGEIVYNRDIARKGRWTYFADIPTIPAKGGRKRIVLLGESVARGFLLDPGFTPAQVLGALLNGNADKDEFEIVDLAETNLGMAGLKERYREALALKPDMVLLLAGNNWREDLVNMILTDKAYLSRVREALVVNQDIASARTVLEELFATLVGSFLEYVRTLGGPELPVVFAIPEFNLLDCRSTPGERFISRLPDNGIAGWIAARDQAELALKEQDAQRCITAATSMIALDPSHPYGYELLADVHLLLQEYDKARVYLETARDTALFCRTNSKPRMFNVTRQTILREAAGYQIEVVDIPEVFNQHLNGRIPGRDLFLDYCHFTAEGIQIAMQSVADKILALSGNKTSGKVPAASIRPEQEVHAMAHLFAAIHNAHWGQQYEILYHHCVKALQYSKEIAKTMIYYCDMMNRSASNNLCKTLEILVTGNTRLDRYVHALLHPRAGKTMEIDLVNAIVAALQTAGVNLNKYVDDLRNKEHGVTAQAVNLLETFYHATSYDEYQGTKAAFYQARDAQSVFFLVAAKDEPVFFDISLRVPQLQEEGKITLLLNGVQVSEVTVSGKWTRHSLTVPADICTNGINTVTICWPVPALLVAGERQAAADDTILDAAFYVFGEIVTFTATSNTSTHFELN
jgi:hypothetical protein